MSESEDIDEVELKVYEVVNGIVLVEIANVDQILQFSP